MMRSLWAGVTGLQAHQIAMDVEGNNIANVNTVGFKYSRANFSDLLSQTAKIATAPQGELGGKNPMQIGLGTQVSSVTKIFKQGSVQTTDKNTDLAIQGDGFFVVSPDGGSTYKYTRNGDFAFDAQGNFTEGNGYIVQGWLRDEATGEIDATTPIANITIPPGLTTPANDTSYITLKANLNSGDTIVNKSKIYTLDSKSGWVDLNGNGLQETNEVHVENDVGDDAFNTDKALYERGQDLGALFNSSGEAFNLENNQGMWVSFAEARTNNLTITAHASGTTDIDLTINGTAISGSIVSTDDDAVATYIASLINEKTASTGVQAQITGGNQIYLTNTNKSGTEDATKNIKLVKGSADTTTFASVDVITAYKYTYSKTPLNTTHTYDDAQARTFTTTEDLRAALQTDARLWVDYTHDGAADKNDGVEVIVNEEGQFQISNVSGDALDIQDGDVINTAGVTTRSGTLLTADLATEAISFPIGTTFTEVITPSANVIVNGVEYGPTGAGGLTIPAGTTLTEAVTLPVGTTVADTAADMTLQIGTNYLSTDDFNMYISVTALTDVTNNVSENSRFTTAMAALQGTLNTGTGIRTTQNIYAASHASSIDVYDSLGSKHTVRFEFTKTGFTEDGGTEWSILISVPEPGDINLGSYPKNIVTGTISFNSDGSLATFSPTNLTYTANNGSTPNQNIELNFGTLGQFDGMTSFDAQSNTSGISQDGYPGGDLAGIRVDETGTLIGSFTNGRSFGLAQVAMAKFTNNEGLESDGGNAFIQTSNSGDPIIGQAAIGGRGFIQASSLEMSNVDLSRSLTQLIVVQRGYQANSKTITTSDQMLNTLLQLKQ
ncbi:MAG TPA: flagellar hook protein FlgE [Sulfurospirillum sp. UBA12182]|nr:MAG TPA: flagellar hook protein FlgE [Sulfurospirillum sp. UBA12182]